MDVRLHLVFYEVDHLGARWIPPLDLRASVIIEITFIEHFASTVCNQLAETSRVSSELDGYTESCKDIRQPDRLLYFYTAIFLRFLTIFGDSIIPNQFAFGGIGTTPLHNSSILMIAISFFYQRPVGRLYNIIQRSEVSKMLHYSSPSIFIGS